MILREEKISVTSLMNVAYFDIYFNNPTKWRYRSALRTVESGAKYRTRLCSAWNIFHYSLHLINCLFLVFGVYKLSFERRSARSFHNESKNCSAFCLYYACCI